MKITSRDELEKILNEVQDYSARLMLFMKEAGLRGDAAVIAMMSVAAAAFMLHGQTEEDFVETARNTWKTTRLSGNRGSA